MGRAKGRRDERFEKEAENKGFSTKVLLAWRTWSTKISTTVKN
jgi:hypothetical protein